MKFGVKPNDIFDTVKICGSHKYVKFLKSLVTLDLTGVELQHIFYSTTGLVKTTVYWSVKGFTESQLLCTFCMLLSMSVQCQEHFSDDTVHVCFTQEAGLACGTVNFCGDKSFEIY